MTITAKYASTCPHCNGAIQPGQPVEWSKGTKARHVSCAGSSTSAAPAASAPRARKQITHCVGCGCKLDTFQVRRGFKFCSSECVNDRRLGGMSGYVNGSWHQGSDD